jgi:hypothetical protein
MVVTGQLTSPTPVKREAQRPLTANKPPMPQQPLATGKPPPDPAMAVRRQAAARVVG